MDFVLELEPSDNQEPVEEPASEEPINPYAEEAVSGMLATIIEEPANQDQINVEDNVERPAGCTCTHQASVEDYAETEIDNEEDLDPDRIVEWELEVPEIIVRIVPDTPRSRPFSAILEDRISLFKFYELHCLVTSIAAKNEDDGEVETDKYKIAKKRGRAGSWLYTPKQLDRVVEFLEEEKVGADEVAVEEAAFEKTAVQEMAVKEAVTNEAAVEEIAIEEGTVEETTLEKLALEQTSIDDATLDDTLIDDAASSESAPDNEPAPMTDFEYYHEQRILAESLLRHYLMVSSPPIFPAVPLSSSPLHFPEKRGRKR